MGFFMPKTLDQQLEELRTAWQQARTRADRRIIEARAGLLRMAKEKQAQQYPQSTIAIPAEHTDVTEA